MQEVVIMAAVVEFPVEVREENGVVTLVLEKEAASAIVELSQQGPLVLRASEAGYTLGRAETVQEKQLRIGKEIMERYRNVLAALAK
jgi:hypothetical protein